MPVKLNGSTSGSVTLQATAVAGTNTLTLPATTGNIITSADTGTVTFLDRSSVRANGNMKTGKFLMDARNDSSHIWKMGTAIFTVDCKNRRKISLFTQSYDVNGKPLGQAMVDDFNKFGGTDIPPKSEVEKQFLALCR